MADTIRHQVIGGRADIGTVRRVLMRTFCIEVPDPFRATADQ
ncbi:hypothetical protein ACFXJ5_11115 [Streptomyces sp. NPDC059373]